MKKLELLEYVKGYYKEFGNFCAMTDSILEKCNVTISKSDKVTYKNILKEIIKVKYPLEF